MSIDSEPEPHWPLTEMLMTAFLRLVALSCLYFGVRYWAMLIGYSDGGTGRFDLLNLPWRAAGAMLSVLYPVAAIGLWLRASWGPVIWVGIAMIEVAMHEVWPGIFGGWRLMTVTIAAIAVLYVGFRVAMFIDRRRARRKAEESGRPMVRL